MKCQKCGKFPATTHITEIVNGVKNETCLCQYCSKEYSQGSDLHSIFKSNLDSFFEDFWKSPAVLGQPMRSYQKLCPNCKTTFAELQKFGRLGCSQCYDTFRDYLFPTLRNIHGSTSYRGKALTDETTANTTNKTDLLKQELSQAVRDQNFEKAAELRDKIKEMEA